MPSIFEVKIEFDVIDIRNVTITGDKKSNAAFESLLDNYVKAEIKRITPYHWTSFIITISSLIFATVILGILATFIIKYIMKWRYEYKSKYENRKKTTLENKVENKEKSTLLTIITEEDESKV